MFKKISTMVKGVVNGIGGNVSVVGGKEMKTVEKEAPDPALTTTKNTPDTTTTKNTPDPALAPVPAKAGTTYSGATSEAGVAFLSTGAGTTAAASSGANGNSSGTSSSNSGNSSGTNSSGSSSSSANGNGTDPNGQILIISTIVIIYVILKTLLSTKGLLQKIIIIGIAILVYFYF